MIIDALTKLSGAQAVTSSAASTNYIDTLASGDAYVEPFAYFKIDTTMASGSSNSTMNCIVQTSDTTSFASTTTLFDSGAIAQASLVSGKEISGRLAKGAKRYVRAYYTVATQPFSAGAVTAALVKDVATEI